jgi:phosphocarrier protein HPr
MVQRNIRFMTTGQLMTFCNVCQKMNADITVKDVTGRFAIVGLMTIRMGEKMHLLIEGEEEHLADSYFEKFDCTPVTIPFS